MSSETPKTWGPQHGRGVYLDAEYGGLSRTFAAGRLLGAYPVKSSTNWPPVLSEKDSILSLRVQSTQIWIIYGFFIRNRNYNLGYMLHIWVLGPLGFKAKDQADPTDV